MMKLLVLMRLVANSFFAKLLGYFRVIDFTDL